MPGIDLTSSSAERRPPVRFERVPPVATRRTRGTSCADAAVAHSKPANIAAPAARRLFRRARYVGMEWIQVPVEEGPDAIPRVALLARVLGLPRLRVDAAVEGMTARR